MKVRIATTVIALGLTTGCQPEGAQPEGTAPVQGELTVLTHDSFSVSDEALAAFETSSGIKVRFLEGGDTGTLVNKAVLAKGNPSADVLYGVDNTFLSRALDEGIFEPYASPQLVGIPSAFQMDPANGALPVDHGDVCPNYDAEWFAESELDPPADLDDLADPRLRGLTVVQNPATSSPGLSFLMATIQRFGDPGYLDYWADLKANDVRIVSDWETAYSSDFTRAGGARPIVISYVLSPIYEVLFAEKPPLAPPSLAVTGGGSCFRQVEFVGILAGTENRAAAEAWVDFMLSARFQEDLPMQMFVLPVVSDVDLPKEFVAARALIEGDSPTATLDDLSYESGSVTPEQIALNRERWVAEWTEAVLR